MPPPRTLLHCGSSAQLKWLKPLYLMLRPRAVYLVDFACFRTESNCRVPFATFLEHSRVWPGFDERSVWFMTWLLERSRLLEGACLPYVQHYIPSSCDLESSSAEAELVIFSAIDDLLAKNGRRERA
ncbi:3-ketoacyl-CoA synthase 6-like [Miscanthus floridulus]|uniref:3-ketoacyl-CoA synthase 6-like n=1 Tax=Miscanthus floridulus TaxID=154761 RepID=UPI0034586CA6